MAERESFLGRWSRRKAAARADGPAEADARQRPAEQAAAVEAEAAPVLPSIDDLDLASDFSRFMQPGVPDALRKQALRKLWLLDPDLSRPDGLVEYGEDYAAAFRAGHIVRTAWRLGKGMPAPKREEPESAGAGDEPAVAGARDMPEAEASAMPEDES